MRIVILGLSITSSWGNGHATTYRGLVRALAARGHDILFLERDTPWYAANRDLPAPPFGETHLYGTLPELERQWTDAVKAADLVIVGSYVPDGIAVGEWAAGIAQGVTAFYDIDTPVTLAQLARNECAYVSPSLISRCDLYLSFAGGKVLDTLETQWHARRARPFLCAFDPDVYSPEPRDSAWDLGYLGTYSDDRQPALSRLLLQAAQQWPQGRFCVAGPQYPPEMIWPVNVSRREHLPPAEHRAFYNSQRFALNITRADMIALGWSPSVRLFEAAACAVPVISDWWTGLDDYFTPGKEILISHGPDETLSFLRDLPEDERRAIGAAAHARALSSHTAAHRAQQLEQYVQEVHAG